MWVFQTNLCSADTENVELSIAILFQIQVKLYQINDIPTELLFIAKHHNKILYCFLFYLHIALVESCVFVH